MAGYGNTLQVANLKPFDGNGFSNWEFRLKLVLEQNDLLNTLEEVSEEEDFRKKDRKARNIIVQWLGDNVLDIVKNKKTAKTMYETLRSTYVQKGLSIQVEIQRKLRNMRFTGGTVSNFIMEFEKTVTELKNSGGMIQEGEIISQLLASMPESYQAIVTTIDVIFSQDPSKINFELVKNKLLQEEVRQTSRSEQNGSAAFAVFRKRGGYYRGKPRKHETTDEKSPKTNTGDFRFKCYQCGKQGHKRSECPDRRSVNVAVDKDENDIAFLVNAPDTCEPSSIGKTADALNVNATYNLIQNNEQVIDFIVDSGATNHMVNKRIGQFLVEEKPVDCIIKVAKRNANIKAEKCGTLFTENDEGITLKIENVLQCNELDYNLLSVKQIEKAGLRIIFEKETVIISKNSKVILQGHLRGNLYIITLKLHHISANVAHTNLDILHRRMGHSSVYPSKNLCEVCIKGKQTREQFKTISEEKKPKRILEVVSSDVAGPFTPETYDGMKYYVTFIDHYTHFAQIYVMKHKNEVFDRFKEYEAQVTSRFQKKISRFRCDNGGEYNSQEFKRFCKVKGIQIEYTVPRNPEQNGVSERLNRTILNMARCLLFDAHLTKSFWGEAVRTAVYIINRLPTTSIKSRTTPAELWYERKVDIDKIRVFGSKAFVHVPKEERGKLDERSKTMFLIGYTGNGYRLWDETANKVVTARSVIFDENTKETVPQQIIEVEPEEDESKKILDNKSTEKKDDAEEQTNGRKSTRQKRIPKKLQDYEMNISDESTDDSNDVMLALSIGFLPFDNPTSYEEAIQDVEWKKAIKQEVRMLEENKTWEVVPIVKGEEIIDSRWIFTEKEVQGQSMKKARLVARGYQQKLSPEEEIYTPVARMVTLRVLLSLAIEHHWTIHQMDVKAAFLNGVLTTPVYMFLPEGVEGDPDTHICKLKKALYGLRSSPKCWYERLNKFLVNINFRRSEVDPCLFIQDRIYLLIWVDDLILVSNNSDNIQNVKSQLSTEFQMKDFSNSNKLTFLGLEIEKVGNCIYISQQKLIEKVLMKFNMLNCKGSYTPMQPKLHLEMEKDLNLNVPYKQLIGSLMYVMLGSRPDLCFSIMYFSQFQSNFGVEHWKHLKNVLRYLQHTKAYRLKYSQSKMNLNVQAYVDSDFANDLNDRISISGFILKLNGNTVLWKSKKQTVVALSSSEAEYVALANCVTECLFLKQLLENMLEFKINCIRLYEDNQSSIMMASTLETKRSKHIDVKHHFVRNYISEGIIKLIYVPTNQQCADIMTKSLCRPKFELFREMLGVMISHKELQN